MAERIVSHEWSFRGGILVREETHPLHVYTSNILHRNISILTTLLVATTFSVLLIDSFRHIGLFFEISCSIKEGEKKNSKKRSHWIIFAAMNGIIAVTSMTTIFLFLVPKNYHTLPVYESNPIFLLVLFACLTFLLWFFAAQNPMKEHSLLSDSSSLQHASQPLVQPQLLQGQQEQEDMKEQVLQKEEEKKQQYFKRNAQVFQKDTFLQSRALVCLGYFGIGIVGIALIESEAINSFTNAMLLGFLVLLGSFYLPSMIPAFKPISHVEFKCIMVFASLILVYFFPIQRMIQTEISKGVIYSFLGIALYTWFLSPKQLVKCPPQSKSVLKRRYRSYPFGYPNGWYMLEDSKNLKEGDLLNIDALGNTFAVFRGEDGKVAVLDAYCPHLGANIAAGGRVIGNQVECPFHRWRFNGDGKCSHIPYTECIPSIASIKSWPCMEWYGMILVYFDAEGRDPPYQPEIVQELQTHDFRFIGSSETQVHMHLCEFAENSADTQHFSCLHGQMTIPFTSIPIIGVTINHEPEFHVKDHVVIFKDHATLNLFGKRFESTGADATITLSGPGGTVCFTFETQLGKVILFHMHTPQEPLLQKIRFRYFAEKSMPTLLAHYIVGNWISQFQADREVWENKVYWKKPLLAKNDGPIAKVRRWYNQFYSENSKNVSFGKLDW